MGRSGFTLLEILLALAIIALLAGALVGGSARLVQEQAVSPHDVFWKAVREARKAALRSEHEIRLKFDKEKRQFLLVDGMVPAVIGPDGMAREEAPLKVFPIQLKESETFTLEFLGPPSRGAAVAILGGVVVETQTIPYATFYPDGTCSQFRTQVMRNGAASILSIDPWTCAQVLTPGENNAP